MLVVQSMPSSASLESQLSLSMSYQKWLTSWSVSPSNSNGTSGPSWNGVSKGLSSSCSTVRSLWFSNTMVRWRSERLAYMILLAESWGWAVSTVVVPIATLRQWSWGTTPRLMSTPWRRRSGRCAGSAELDRVGLQLGTLTGSSHCMAIGVFGSTIILSQMHRGVCLPWHQHITRSHISSLMAL